MIQRQISVSLRHYATIAELSVRDTATAVSNVVLVCILCWYIGHPMFATALAFSILITEVTLRLMFNRIGPFAGLSRRQIVLTAVAIHVTNVILYSLPAVLLATNPSLALKVTGLLSIAGIQIYITNTWSRLPLFLCAMLGPAIVMLGLTFLGLEATAPTASPLIHWAFATGFLFIFVFMSIDTLRQQIATEGALLAAQHDATLRMKDLEEAQRTDPLTGLLNRPAFDAALNVILSDRATNGGEISVFLLDLDSFKPINDTYSHEAGDAVLIEIARRLKAHVGNMGIAGRLGGDEFVCAVQGLDDAQDAAQFAAAMMAVAARPIQWRARTLKTKASIGFVRTGDGPPAPPAQVAALCAAADQAMFAAKSSPNGTPVQYLTDRFAPRMSPEDKQLLVEGLADRKIRPYYQPKIHLPTGQIIGFEALARWEHPQQGLLGPDVFAQQINDMGLQGDFMVSMAHQVVEDVMNMLDDGLDPGQVSLNVSEVALATHSGQRELQQIIADAPRAAKHLTFEITEDVFIGRAADTIQSSIASFRDLGVRISLDDFGTGFASFHHLRQLDFDELKIDASFIADLGRDPTAEVLVRGFLDIASGLGVSVVAEGVETDAQSRDLINMGCMTAQGFLFSGAVPPDRATDLLRDQRAA